jgi:hypothetical protein
MNFENQYLSYASDCDGNNKKEHSTPIATKGCTNSGFNFGMSSRLQYDSHYITDNIEQSTAPILSVLDPTRVKNCNQCLSLNGPRAGHNGWGNNIPIAEPGNTPAQELIDIDSIMSNRNVKQDRSKKGGVNEVDVFKFKTYDSVLCGKDLDPVPSILTYPKQLYREMSINRFYDLNTNPQVNIYYNGAVNSQLEAKDNYDSPYPYFIDNAEVLPTPVTRKPKGSNPNYNSECDVNVLDNYPKNNMNKFVSDSESEYESDSDNEYK